MPSHVQFQEMLDSVRRSLEEVPEHRTGQNGQYEILDAGLGAFSVFHMQSPSFMAYQRLCWANILIRSLRDLLPDSVALSWPANASES